MKVLILSSLRSKTGNNSTALRIRQEVVEFGIECELADVNQFTAHTPTLSQYVQELGITCAVGIHAWRSGSLLWNCLIPYCVVFGGTDINENYQDEQKMKTMTKAVENARFLVAFSSAMMEQVTKLWPSHKDKIVIQPQAVVVNTLEASMRRLSCQSIYSEHNLCLDLCSKDTIIFVLVAGLRQVKDPLFLAQAISEWHEEDPNVYLVIVGPELNEEFATEVKRKVKMLPGVEMIPPLPSSDVHALIKHSFAVVNSSKSEGMATALIEAMALGVPVMARNIPANAVIVDHRKTGLLFNNPQEFISLAKGLVRSQCAVDILTTNAKQYVQTVHSYEKEKETYQSLIKKMAEC